MSCEQLTKKKYIFIYECEEDKIAKIKDDIIECEIKGFEIINNFQKEVMFLAIDNCLLDSKDEERCDFGFEVENDFFLVELKTDVKPKNRKKRLNKAISQLKSCINLFKNKNIKECFVCFDKEVTVKSSWENKKIDFFDEIGIELEISCKKDLDKC